MGRLTLGSDIRELLTDAIDVGSEQQAFPLVTVDVEGFPYVSLVSRTELRVWDESTLLIAVRGTNTRANLVRDGHAGMIAIGGTTAHYLTLRVIGHRRGDALEAFVLDVVRHRRDSLGIELSPISYEVTSRLVELEDWEQTAALLSALEAELAC